MFTVHSLCSLLSGDLGWYSRVENNGWRPLAVRFASEGLVDKAGKWEEECTQQVWEANEQAAS